MSSNSSRGPNPSGLCRCGCGRRTKLARRNRYDIGHVRGEPISFIHGHHMRGERNNHYRGGRSVLGAYWGLNRPNHARAWSNGFVLEHVVIAERALGKPLPDGAVVHHANGDSLDNSRGNLVICEDRSYHTLLHKRMRAAGVGAG